MQTESQQFISFLMRHQGFTPRQVCNYLDITVQELAQALRGEIEVVEVITSTSQREDEIWQARRSQSMLPARIS